MDAQVTTQQLPIWMIPRIDGKVKTITQIKEQYSNNYVDDLTTPINFWLEYETPDGTKNLIFWDSSKTIDDYILYFPVDDTVYETLQNCSVLFFWTLGDVGDPPEVPAGKEKIYTIAPQTLEIKDLHTET